MKDLKINSYALKVALGVLEAESFRKVMAALYDISISNRTSRICFVNENFSESEKFMLKELIESSEIADWEKD